MRFKKAIFKACFCFCNQLEVLVFYMLTGSISKGKYAKKVFSLRNCALDVRSHRIFQATETVESEKLHSRRCVLFLHFSSFLRRENYHIVKKVSDRLAKLLQLIWYISLGTRIVAFLRLLSRHHKKVYFVKIQHGVDIFEVRLKQSFREFG